MAVFGFTGSVSDVQYARMQALNGNRVSVETPTSWLPTVTGADRTVSFAAGAGYILGLRDERAGAFTVQQAANATGALRLDLIVMRANWTAKTVTPTAITGSSPTALPAINKTLLATGDTYDFPICVCRTPNGGGAYSAGDIRDIRPYGGLGHLTVPQQDHISAHDLVPGQRWRVEGTSLEYIVDSASALKFSGIQRFAQPAQTGSGALGAGVTATVATISIPDPGTAYRIETWGSCETSTPAVGFPASLQATYDSTTWDTNRIGDTAFGIGPAVGLDNVIYLPEQRSGSLTGARTLRLLVKATGGNAVTVNTINYSFGARLVSATL